MPSTSADGASNDWPRESHAAESTWRSDTSVNEKVQTLDRRRSFRPLRKALGLVGTLSIVVGTLVILGVLAFLVFLWTAEGPNEGAGAMPLWRTIVLEQWFTQVITLISVLLRFTNALQASVCTGLIAALILERHGVPLKNLAEFSMIRSINDGPFRLSWLLSSHPRRSPGAMTLLAFILFLGTLAIQFTSTILVSDLSASTIVGHARNDSRGIAATQSTLNQFRISNQYALKPIFTPFGEVPGADPSPNDQGVSDTGVVRRVQPFVSSDNRTSLRNYRGLSLVMNSRMVCLRPVMSELTLTADSVYNPSFENTYIPSISGSISYNETFRYAGVEFPEGCPGGKCFPSKYKCSVAVQVGYEGRGRPAIAGCIPSGRNAIVDSKDARKHLTIRPEPIANTSEVFLFTKSNLNANTNFTDNNSILPSGVSSEGEWTTYGFGRGIEISMSLCFQQLHYDRSNVELETSRNLEDGTVQFIANDTHWDTSRATTVFGSPDYVGDKSPAQRGIYTVKRLWNSTLSDMTRYLTFNLISESYSSYLQPNMSIALSPYGGGEFPIFPHVEYQALFADVLEATNRPGVALQNLITALSGSIIDSLLSQLDYMDDVETVSSVSVPAPRRRTGLIAVLLIHAVNVVAVVVIVSLYLVGTECSSQGNYWHAIAQIMSDITEPVLHRSAQATDDEVAFALKDYDADVKIARAQPSGRVQLVRCEDPYV